ncbi:hypothetical protein UlMin_042190 [Ulmus minor]
MNAKTRNCLLSVLEIGLVCSRESPRERATMNNVTMELHHTKSTFLSNQRPISSSLYPYFLFSLLLILQGQKAYRLSVQTENKILFCRSYKNGFVWQDLTENDFIYPCRGHEYILKGSQLLDTSLSFRSFETVSSFSSNSSSIFSRETNSSQTTGDLVGKAMDASKQTDEKARLRRTREDCEGNGGSTEVDGDRMVENARDFGRIKASTILRQLIKCGSRKIKDYSELTKTKRSHNAV